MKTVQAIIESRGGLAALQEHPIALANPPYMRLCIEYIGQGPRGLPMISVAHYGEQNGDAMRDPDMCFEIYVSTAPGAPWWDWMPVSFRNDYAGIDQEAVFEDESGRVMIRPRLVKDLDAFARTWDRNIKAQGYCAAAAASVRKEAQA